VTALEDRIREAIQVAIAHALRKGSPEDLAICCHEAAHALAAWSCLAPPLREVSVSWVGGGQTDNRRPRPEGTPDVPIADVYSFMRRDHPGALRAITSRQIVTLLAGRAADERGDYRADRSCSQSDIDKADHLAAETVGPVGLKKFKAPLEAAALSLVSDGWPIIRELAAWLCDERRLPGPVVTAWLDCREDARKLRDHYGAAYAAPTTQGPSVVPGAVEPTDLAPRASLSAQGATVRPTSKGQPVVVPGATG
jgi:hypothetical protein